MSTLTRIAHPVPKAGSALDGSGEAYIASLDIIVEGFSNEMPGATAGVMTTGDCLESLLMALRIRHTAFHPRTFAFDAQPMGGMQLVEMIESRWASVDAQGPETVDLANAVLEVARTSDKVIWRQTN